ncbi:hypothetical protein [Curtobacterium sp. VKM Ac-1376]|uniref:hypothetical protein n=1 Tax=Curtobacterium sp. VKM Ac-1376 TaxID=123312 RepID=UPI00188A5F59|nr:hypothetical protein [Curtobacterium sp. VKM Ac-1376]MBF4614486.1 hypothetical protein [Curtobacterium sp. VKM Ac-1376]
MPTTPVHTDHPDRWIATDDESALLGWAADRSAAGERHLVPVADVGRTTSGRLVVDLERPTGTPLAAALDRLGTPTTGVAVTLTVPLLELLVAAHDGAVRLGTAGIDDVIVDDAGAVVVCDHPTGADGSTASASDLDAAMTLVLAARTVWDRVDPGDPVRHRVLTAVQDALEGDRTAVRAALDVVRGSAAPRPFRWSPVPSDLVFAAPSPPDAPVALVERFRDVVERGIPLGPGRRLPLRRVLVGVVVAVGAVVAALTAVGSG